MLQFYMVWNPNGRAPMYRHSTLDAAVEEAQRLARENGNDEFYVLQAVRVARREMPVSVHTLSPNDDDLPF